MKKIGIIFGMETTFPPALVDKINSMGEPDIQAELATVGEVRMAEPSPYQVIIDRISHDIPFYRAYLKNAALSGTIVINNPFWWSADDKFFNYALGEKLGVAIPPTVLIPHKEHPAGTTAVSYTHLDVYKRQAQKMTAAVSRTIVAEPRPHLAHWEEPLMTPGPAGAPGRIKRQRAGSAKRSPTLAGKA